MMKKLVLGGKILRPHGLRGELVVHPLLPQTVSLESAEGVCLLDKAEGGCPKPTKIVGFRLHKNKYLIKLEHFDSLEKAEALRNWYLGVPELDLPTNQFYVKDLVDMKVYGDRNKYLGKLVEVIATGANDVWVIRDGKKEFLFPALKKLVSKIDLKNKVLEITSPPGLE